MIRFVTSGISTTIQDLGRFGYRKYGVPISGAMDQASSSQANKILNNEANCAVLEMVIKGPMLFFEKDCWIAVSGATIHAECSGKSIAMNKAVLIKAGQQLKLGNITGGRYSYLAVKGGIQSEKVMGSRSLFKGITEHERITKGMLLQHKGLTFESDSIEYPSNPINVPEVRVFVNVNVNVQKGPDFHLLNPEVQKALFSAEFSISNLSNRMGIRLETDTKLFAPEIITSPVFPGIVQLTPNGEMIVLGRDAGVSGGYARVFVIVEGDLHKVFSKSNLNFVSHQIDKL